MTLDQFLTLVFRLESELGVTRIEAFHYTLELLKMSIGYEVRDAKE